MDVGVRKENRRGSDLCFWWKIKGMENNAMQAILLTEKLNLVVISILDKKIDERVAVLGGT